MLTGKPSFADVAGTKFLTKWHNYPSSENTWQSAASFDKRLLKDFEAKGIMDAVVAIAVVVAVCVD